MTDDLPDRYRPRTSQDVVGQDVIAGLIERVKTGDHSTGVILHGPSGAGKMTLARLYAQALQCEAPSSTRSRPCGACDTCLAFNEKGTFSYRPIDAADEGSVDEAREIAHLVRYGALDGARRVVVIENVDAYSAAAFDSLLKTLEEPSRNSAFVLLTTNLKGLRAAGLSRCKIFRVGPLEPARARECLVNVCLREGVAYDEAAIEVLIAHSRGLVGRLLRAWWRVASTGDLTLSRTLAALDLTWGNQMIEYWRAALQGDYPAARQAFAQLGNDIDQAIGRVRLFLVYIYVRGIRNPPAIDGTPDPAMMRLSADDFEQVLNEFRERAAARGSTLDALWEESSRFWLASHPRESIGLAEELWAFQQLLANDGRLRGLRRSHELRESNATVAS